ncbi:hypothetical protein LC653_06665 [Nostoc sp. CHAB 5784]|uniref:hypothetical protein n=1 Tax=Nostoc mirabile TaxID=2907820 RepID=UPI001E579D7E|nr:hypothetical protein [Nostoc mirabile]MCC5663616.1 hypothetical protein [Nostoc mirabile CHAB5784]
MSRHKEQAILTILKEKMMEMLNYLHDEPLFAELKPEEAETIKGGLTFSEPYTTQGVSTRLRIRSGPSIDDDNIVGYWYPGQVKYLQSPAILKNGFRKFSSSVNKWVSIKFIKRAPGKPLPD